jgi:hypothetical protein
MGLFDFLSDGGSEVQKADLPGYLERPTKGIANGIWDLLRAGRDNGGMNATQQQALQGMIAQAQQPSGLASGASNWLTGLLQGGSGLNQQQAGLAGQLTAGQVVNPAMAETARIAQGGDLGKNPYLNAQYQQGAQQLTDQFKNTVVPGLDNSFAASGRLGSGAYAQLRNQTEKGLAQGLGDLATNIYGGAYNTDRANQMSALNQWQGLGQNAIGNQVSGANLFGTGQQNLFSAVGAAPGAQNLNYDQLNRMYQAGTIQQQAPWQLYQNAAGIIGGLPGSQNQTTQQRQNPVTGAINLGASAAGAFMASDVRLKADIVRVGATPLGIPVYRYRYVWDEPGTERLGVMAQEVLPVLPEAVAQLSSGYLAVDYGRIR